MRDCCGMEILAVLAAASALTCETPPLQTSWRVRAAVTPARTAHKCPTWSKCGSAASGLARLWVGAASPSRSHARFAGTPVDPGQGNFARGRLDMPCQDIVVTYSGAGLDRLEHEIHRSIGLHDFVMPDGVPGFDVHRQLLPGRPDKIPALKHLAGDIEPGSEISNAAHIASHPLYERRQERLCSLVFGYSQS